MNLMDWIIGGKIEEVDPREASERLAASPAPVLLDVRQPEEYREGHVDGARLLPLGELGSRLDQIPADSDILCICASGARSRAAVKELASRKYRAVNIRGGMMGWRMAGLPVKTGK